MAQNAPSSFIQPGGANLVTDGGTMATYDVTAAKVIKATPGRLCKFIIVTVGTAGSAWQFNDCTTTGAAAAANEIFTIGATTAAGTVVTLDWPCEAGIVLSAVPTNGVCSVSWS